MDLLDVILVIVALLAAIHGFRLGAIEQVLTFGGFLIGMVLGALIDVAIEPSLRSQTVRAVFGLVLVLVVALVFGALGRMLGTWSHLTLKRWHLGPVDGALGAAVAGAAVLLSAWLMASLVVQVPSGWLGSQIQRSVVLKAVDHLMPPVPTVFADVQSFLSTPGLPSVFAGLPPVTAPPVTVPSRSEAAAIAAKADNSMVKVVGQACNYLQEGSGFVVAPGMVVTNAHVVAGEPSTEVQVSGGTYPATPVFYDPTFDLAVLRTDAPLGPPLKLDPDDVGRGTEGAVLGYPEDGPLVVGAAGVDESLTAAGRNIYNQGYVVRKVYQLSAEVRPGNSGGPLLDAAGEVIGVVFSRSTVYPDVGYALSSPGVLARVVEATDRVNRVSTGACLEQ